MKNKKVICAGHICLDITPVFRQTEETKRIDELITPGKLIHVSEADVHTGGSVANTGLAMKMLGCDVELMGKIGRDSFGQIVRSILNERGCGGVIEDPDVSTSYSVVLAIPGNDRVFLHHPGANDTFVCGDVDVDRLKDARLLHFGYPPLMRKMYENGGSELALLMKKAKDAGCMTGLDLASVDPQSDAGRADWQAILERTLPYTDFFVPSFEELLYMMQPEVHARLTGKGKDITSGLDVERYAAPLARRCIEAGAGVVLIKCSTSGMYLMTGSGERLSRLGARSTVDPGAWKDYKKVQRCYKAEVVRSATGAGDVSIAAFYTAMLEGYAPGECTEFAAAEGARAVTSYDALGAILPLDALRAVIEKERKAN